MSDIQHVDYRTKQQMRNKELETLRQKKFTKRKSIQTTEVEKETPKEEESHRAKNITAFLANQTQSILEERRQQRSPLDRLQAYSPLTWVQKQMNKIEMADEDHASTWKQVVEKALEEMNKEIWQYEKRTIITDAQSIALLVTTALFLLRFAPLIFRTAAFAFRRLSIPAACAYLVYPVTKSGTSGIPSEITVNMTDSTR